MQTNVCTGTAINLQRSGCTAICHNNRYQPIVENREKPTFPLSNVSTLKERILIALYMTFNMEYTDSIAPATREKASTWTYKIPRRQ